jgi:hypothetical protein
MKQYIFFLGGHDLEMEEIGRMARDQGAEVVDRDLSWGAKASSYKDDLKKIADHVTPVLLELGLDIALPEGAVALDHHGESAGEATVLEQAAELLGVELSREQRLIAANDRGHIPAMLEAGASLEEALDIRRRDRKAQGVTEEDERLAEAALCDASRLEEPAPGAVIVESLTDRTSAVGDRLWAEYEQIAVYTPDGQFHYFGLGRGVQAWIAWAEGEEFDHWCGGDLPERGFFGCAEAPDKTEVRRIMSKARRRMEA